MQQHLNLIKTEYRELEKRTFPRFPFSYLTFKAQNGSEKVFEVVDISYTGMQLALKDGGHTYTPEKMVQGHLHWRGASLDIEATVKWISGRRLGVEFVKKGSFEAEIRQFLSIENIVSGMRPIHQSNLDMELPSNLKYWITADGPVEIFVWRHNDGEISRFQSIMLDAFVEWEDGKGLKTGHVLTKRDVDTPLLSEDEFVFQIDEQVDESKMQFAKDVVGKIPAEYLSEEALDFLKTKLG